MQKIFGRPRTPDSDTNEKSETPFQAPKDEASAKQFLESFLGILLELKRLRGIMASGPYPAKSLDDIAHEHELIQILFSIFACNMEPDEFFDQIRNEHPAAYEKIEQYYWRQWAQNDGLTAEDRLLNFCGGKQGLQ